MEENPISVLNEHTLQQAAQSFDSWMNNYQEDHERRGHYDDNKKALVDWLSHNLGMQYIQTYEQLCQLAVFLHQHYPYQTTNPPPPCTPERFEQAQQDYRRRMQPHSLQQAAQSFDSWMNNYQVSHERDGYYDDNNKALVDWLSVDLGMLYIQTYEQLCQLADFLHQDYPYQTTNPPCTPERFEQAQLDYWRKMDSHRTRGTSRRFDNLECDLKALMSMTQGYELARRLGTYPLKHHPYDGGIDYAEHKEDSLNMRRAAEDFDQWMNNSQESHKRDGYYDDNDKALVAWLVSDPGFSGMPYIQTYEQLCQLADHLQHYRYQTTNPPCTPERFEQAQQEYIRSRNVYPPWTPETQGEHRWTSNALGNGPLVSDDDMHSTWEPHSNFFSQPSIFPAATPNQLQSAINESFSLPKQFSSNSNEPFFTKNQAILEELGVDEIPEELNCDITNQIMDNPVKIDGNAVVDRAALAKHLASYHKNPFTNDPMTADDLKKINTDQELKEKITTFVETKRNEATAQSRAGDEKDEHDSKETDSPNSPSFG